MKKIMPVMYCFLSRFAGARFFLNKRRAQSSLSGTPLATRGPYLRATRVGGNTVSSGHSGLRSVFPANECGTRHKTIFTKSPVRQTITTARIIPQPPQMGLEAPRPLLEWTLALCILSRTAFGNWIDEPGDGTFLQIIPPATVIWQSALDPSGMPAWSMKVNVDIDLAAPSPAAHLVRTTWDPSRWHLCLRAAFGEVHGGLRANDTGFPSSCTPLSQHQQPKDPFIGLPPISSKYSGTVTVAAWLERPEEGSIQRVGVAPAAGDIVGFNAIILKGAPPAAPGNAIRATVTADMWGGLGNQLYIVFATIAYARRHGLGFSFQNNPMSIKSGEDRTRTTYWNTLLKELKPYLVTVPNHPNSLNLAADDWIGNYLPMPPPPVSVSSHMTLHWQIGSFDHFDKEALEVANLAGLLPQRDYACEYLRQHFLSPVRDSSTTTTDATVSVSLHFR